MTSNRVAKICAGVPAINYTLFWRIQFQVGDPVALLEIPTASGTKSILIMRDIEMDRGKKFAKADQINCPADFAPEGGLSGDRETATAQAAAECLIQEGMTEVIADRSLPFIFVEFLTRAGISVQCDTELWVTDRRQKNEQEIEYLREAQQVTEQAIQYACEMVANAEAKSDGSLYQDGAPLTSERVRAAVDHFLMDRGYQNPTCIIAGGSTGADCHDYGSGPLYTEQTVIIDIFPQNRTTLYNGDCTRTVVHGEIPDEIQAMHKVVKLAKAAGEAATAPGVTGEQVHQATIQVLLDHGYNTGLADENSPSTFTSMPHGTGHGIGLNVHEPPLLDFKGPELLIGDALTIEPGLYRKKLGGVRVEDMVVVTADGCVNLNQLSEELTWN
ncbi:MAG: M24 family metallopeptidase [Pirellulales bacterium]